MMSKETPFKKTAGDISLGLVSLFTDDNLAINVKITVSKILLNMQLIKYLWEGTLVDGLPIVTCQYSF